MNRIALRKTVLTLISKPFLVTTLLVLAACSGGGNGNSSSSVNSASSASSSSSSVPIAPVITTLSPNSTSAGGAAFTLTINGSGFTANSLANWNGSNRSTTFVSATQLTASITASDIASASTVQVSVVNADGSTSNQMIFTINPRVQAVSCLVNDVTYYGLPGRTNLVDIAFTYNDTRQITNFGQVGAGAGYNSDVSYDTQGKISAIGGVAVLYNLAFVTMVGQDFTVDLAYSWNLNGFSELDSLYYPEVTNSATGTRKALTIAWDFDPTGAVRSQSVTQAGAATQTQWAVSTFSSVAALKSPFIGLTPEQRFIYFYGLYGRAVTPELLVGSFLPLDTFESFHYVNGQKEHLGYYYFEYTLDGDSKVTTIVGYQTDGVTRVAGGEIDLKYDCR